MNIPEVIEYNKYLESKSDTTKKKKNDKKLEEFCFGKKKKKELKRKMNRRFTLKTKEK